MYCTWMDAHPQNSNNSCFAHFGSHFPRPKTLDVATPDQGMEVLSKRRPSDMQTVIGKNRNLKNLWVFISFMLHMLPCISFVTSYTSPKYPIILSSMIFHVSLRAGIGQPPLPWQVPRPLVSHLALKHDR